VFLTKIWFILIAILLAVAVTIAVIAPRPVAKKMALLEGQRLDRAQYAAEQMFKVDAHKWIDRVGKLGRDAIISESLDAASRGSGEYTVIHRTIGDRFRTLIPDLSSGGIDVIAAVDNKGRVISRVGENDKEYGDYVAGAELIADALRGYLSDDVWGIGGKLQRVAAAPVLSKNRDRIVGAIYVGAETGDALVERLKKNLDVDVALILRGKVIASTRPGGSLDALPALIGQHARDIETVKRTAPLAFEAGQTKLLVVAAPFPGQAGEQQAYYALVGVQPAGTDVRALLSGTTSDDLKWANFPWFKLAGGVFAMIAFGLLLQRYEIESPLRKLRREVQKIASGDLHKVHDAGHHGHIGGLARDLNAAIERFTHAPSARSEHAGKDLGAILGPAGGSTFDLPSTDSAFSGSASAFAPAPAPSFAPPPLPSFTASPAPSFPPPKPFSVSAFGASSASAEPAPSSGGGIKMPWSSLPPAALDGGGGGGGSDGEPTRVVPYDAGDEEEAHYRHIFDDFMDRKRECGESTAGLTRDKFLQKLRDNKATLVEKHNCRTVRFSVYIKDGKAALKATPIRD